MARVGALGENRARGGEPAGSRHRGIHHHDLRRQLLDQPNRFLSVARFPDDGDRVVVFQQTPEAAPHQGMIVDEQDGDLVASYALPEP